MYINFQFWGSGALYLRFEMCLEGTCIIGQFRSYLRHKHKSLILSHLSDFMTFSACINFHSERTF